MFLYDNTHTLGSWGKGGNSEVQWRQMEESSQKTDKVFL